MNREKAIRQAFYQAINGQLQVTVNGSPVDVPVYDSKMESAEPVYALLMNQSATWIGNFSQFLWRCSQEIEIVHRQTASATKDLVDEVSEQIETILLYAPTEKPDGNGLPEIEGYAIRDVVLNTVNSFGEVVSETDLYLRKIIQFEMTLEKFL